MTAINTDNMPLLLYTIEQKPLKKDLNLATNYAQQRGKLNAFKELLPYAKADWTNWTWQAAQSGYQDIVDYLLDENGNNTRLLNIAFTFAIQSNNLDLVKDLINRGVTKKKIKEIASETLQHNNIVNADIRNYLQQNYNV